MTDERLVHLASRDPVPAPEVEDPTVRDALRTLTARLAREPASWGLFDAEDVRARFDERASDWATRDTPEYRFPLEDALQRGDVPEGGLCLEIGSGTGIQTPTLLGHFETVVALDLSFEMLRRTPPGRGLPLRADAAHLPLRPGAVAAVVCVNAFLFAPEYLATLAPAGVLVFVSTRAERTPIYLDPEEVLDALSSVEEGVHAVTARAGQGCWTVARRG